MSRRTKAQYVGPGAGEALTLGALPLAIRVGDDATDGSWFASEQPIPSGLLVPPHQHTYEDQWSYVLEGTLGFKVGDQEYEAPAGSSIFRPRGVPHALWNAGTATARMLEVTSPGAIEEYFRAFDSLSGDATPAQVRELGGRHGITYVDDWVPYLCDKYGVTTTGGFYGARAGGSPD